MRSSGGLGQCGYRRRVPEEVLPISRIRVNGEAIEPGRQARPLFDTLRVGFALIATRLWVVRARSGRRQSERGGRPESRNWGG